jgi:hypothetical protein
VYAVRIVFGLFLLAHGLIHASYLTPAPPATAGGPEWPFDMAKSWLATGLGLEVGAVRAIGTVLVAVVVIGFALAAFSWLGVVAPREWWPWLAVGSAAASAILLAAFFHPWLVLGFVIDAVLLWLVLGAAWTAEATAP